MKLRILGIDIAYFTGYVIIEQDNENISIIETGTINVKNKKDHKEWYLRVEIDKLIQSSKPDLILFEEQFKRDMYKIDGIVSSCIPPNINFKRIFSRTARKDLFGNGALSKEDSGKLIIEKYPELKDKCADILDAMIVACAWVEKQKKDKEFPDQLVVKKKKPKKKS